MKPKTEKFCLIYLKNGSNGTEAALEAGFGGGKDCKDPRHAAAAAASRLLKQQEVKDYLKAAGKELYDRLGLSPERVAAELWSLYQRSAEGREKLDRDGEPTGVWEYDGRTAVNCLKALGDYMQMFKTPIELSGSVNNPLAELPDGTLEKLIAKLEEDEA